MNLKTWFKNTITENNESMSTDPNFYLNTISDKFSFDANGEHCNFQQWFERYMKFKSSLQSIKVEINNIIVEKNTIAANYWVKAEKKDGSQLVVKIIGFFIVENSRFVYCDEVVWIAEGSL